MRDRRNSVRRCSQSRRTPATSVSDTAAAMTTAPRVGWGTYRMSELAKSRTTAITTAPTIPVTWDREPAWSATAVRDPLVLTGKPWKAPAAMLAAPMPIISWLPSTRTPLRAAKLEAVDIVSASATTAMARAPSTSGGRSPQVTCGTVKAGRPCGSTPIVSTPWASRSKRFTATAVRATTTRTLGTLGMNLFRSRMPASAVSPMRAAVRLASPANRPDRKALVSATRPLASVEKPKSLGSWPMMMVSASPFM